MGGHMGGRAGEWVGEERGSGWAGGVGGPHADKETGTQWTVRVGLRVRECASERAARARSREVS